jgi:putative transposase
VTFSCYHRLPYLGTPAARNLVERSLETMRVRYDFVVAGYVVMPEHVHLLVSEPKRADLSKALQALKLSVSVQSKQRPFWQARYYDFNVFTPHKRSEKIEYMHNNPVARGLVVEPDHWTWSSYRHYATGERFIVEIESEWTATKRNRAASDSHISESRCGAPSSEELR